MSSIGNVGSSSQLVAVRRITADDLKHVQPAELGAGKPLITAQTPSGGTTAASPLLDSSDDQQAAANAEDKKQEAFARMKVELRAHRA